MNIKARMRILKGILRFAEDSYEGFHKSIYYGVGGDYNTEKFNAIISALKIMKDHTDCDILKDSEGLYVNFLTPTACHGFLTALSKIDTDAAKEMLEQAIFDLGLDGLE